MKIQGEIEYVLLSETIHDYERFFFAKFSFCDFLAKLAMMLITMNVFLKILPACSITPCIW